MLKNKVVDLANARANYRIAEGVRKQVLETFLTSPEYITLLEAEARAKEAMEKADIDLRTLAVDKFKDDGEKQGVGYSIRVGEVIEITDVQAAREWCLANFTPALLLDVKEFKAAAKRNLTPANLITKSEQVTVAVNTNLDEFLDEEEDGKLDTARENARTLHGDNTK